MPYILKRTNGTQLAVIQDGSIDQSTDLIFIGKNYAGYGQTMNENFLQLLENFSSSRSPSKPLTGQIWFDSANLKLNIYDGNRFKSLTVTDSNTARPSDLRTGDQWFDPVNQKLYVYNGIEFVMIGPEKNVAAVQSTFSASLVQDNTFANHTVLQANIGSGSDSVPAVFSKDSFVPASSSLLSTDQKYSNVARGISIPGYRPISLGANKGIGAVPDNEHVDTLFFGAASSAWGMLELYNNEPTFFESNQYIRYTGDGIDIPGSIVARNDAGITVGSSGAMKISASGLVGNISNPNGSRITISSNMLGNLVTALAIDFQAPAVVVLPSTSPATDLGTSNQAFRSLYATNLYSANLIASGTTNFITGNWTLSPGATISGGTVTASSAVNSTNATKLESYTANGTYVHATIDETAYSIAQRDGTGKLTANGINAGQAGATVTGAWTIGVGGTFQATSLLGAGTTGYVVASQTGNANSIAQRDASGALVANNVITPTLSAGTLVNSNGQISGQWTLTSGSSLESTYADLAERYHADAEYAPGTVLVVGGVNEVTTTNEKADPRVAGIVSTNPAFKLNSEAGTDNTHPYIALKGRVPCLVVGPIFRGDRLVTSDKPGYAERSMNATDPIIGIALQDMIVDVGIIEVMVK
jgi:hypothetical protein